MEIKPAQLILLALLGGVLMGISFPFTGGIFPLAFIAFTPLIFINLQLNKVKTARFFSRFGLNYLYFVIFNAITTWWIYNASESGMYMAIFCNSLLMTLPFFFFGFISRFLGENKGLLSLLVLWISLEYAHYYWELSWPWLSFGHVFGEYPMLIQWYSVSGVTGGSLWVLLVNIGFYVLIRNMWIRKEKWRIQAPIVLLISLMIFVPIVSSIIIYYSYEEKTDPINMVVVQPNLDPYDEKFDIPLPDQLELMMGLAKPLIDENTDLIVCPETAISRSVNEDKLDEEMSIITLKQFLRNNHNVNLLIGADGYRLFKEENSLASRYNESANVWYESYNSAFLIDPNRPVQIYHKAKPVLGAETVPFLSWFPFLKDYSVEFGGTSSMIGLGEEPMNFKTPKFNVAPLICYESVYGDYISYFTARGADALCVITNDGWWGDTPGYKQHRMFSRIRAIENRRGLARAANTGISCFIDQRGDIISELGWDEEGAIKAALNRNTDITFFVRYGDVIGRISLFLAIAMFVYAITAYAKTTGLADKSPFKRK